MRSVSLVLVSACTALLALGFGGSARADIVGFNGPWAPVDSSGNLINGFNANVTGAGDGESFTAGLSNDNSTLTLDFNNPNGSADSIFFEHYNGGLPTGIVSWDYAITVDQAGDYEFNESGGFQYFDAGTYTGTDTVDYTAGDYFSFQDVGYNDSSYDTGSPENVTEVLTDFDYVGDATVPEPSSLLLLAGGLAGLRLLRRRRAV